MPLDMLPDLWKNMPGKIDLDVEVSGGFGVWSILDFSGARYMEVMGLNILKTGSVGK